MAFFTRASTFPIPTAFCIALFLLNGGLPRPAYALSDIRDIAPGNATDSQSPAGESAPSLEDLESDDDSIPVIPDPDPLIKRDGTEADISESPSAVVPPIFHDVNQAPEPVRRMRQLIINAAQTGDINALRALMNPGPDQTEIPVQGMEDDPVNALKGMSGDEDGIEILAIILDILSTGFAQIDRGTPEEVYVWPYFVGKSVSTLSPREKVELLRIVTAGDVSDMQEYGNYNFFRIGITPDGRWKFITVGD